MYLIVDTETTAVNTKQKKHFWEYIKKASQGQ